MNRLKLLRENNDLRQSDIANLLNISSVAYSYYENEKRDIPTNILKTLADYYKVSIDYILGKSDISNPEKEKNDPLELTKIGFNMDNYTPPTEKQKEQIRDLLEIILKDNKKDDNKSNK